MPLCELDRLCFLVDLGFELTMTSAIDFRLAKLPFD